MNRLAQAFTTAGLLLAALATSGSVAGQTAIVAVEEENFRAEPSGTILAELLEGAALTIGDRQGRWREATLEAWIYGRSVADQQRPVLDLLVNADGENLRATPNGRRIGRALGGMRLERLETRGDWIRVRRTGWIWEPSIRVSAAPDVAGVPTEPEAREGGDPDPEPEPAPAPAPGSSTRRFVAAGEGTVVLESPAGDTIARLRPGATVEVVAREGDWSRVRMEGWTFTGALGGEEGAAADILVDPSRESLQADPEAYRGRLVEWSIQFIAVQEAERFRADFVEGEPFILARGPGDDAGFVYLAVPPEQLAAVQALSPLERIRVLGRIRTARSALTGAPVLDLIEITRR